MTFKMPKPGFRFAEERPPCPLRRRGRHAAGEDPIKRAQILEGATKIFMKVGFDAASMNDITRAAGVSKGTLYVYFENKEDLFRAMILEAKGKIFSDLRSILATDGAVEDTLRKFAMTLISGLTRDDTVRAMRIAIAVADRFPVLVQAFFGSSGNLPDTLEDYIVEQNRLGRLVVDNPAMAAMQFLQLCTGHVWKMRLFGLMAGPPSEADISATAESAIDMFMRCYGPPAEALRSGT